MGLVPLAPRAGFGVMEGSSTPIPATPFSIPARLEFLSSKHQCPVLGTQRPLPPSLNPLLPSAPRVPLPGPQTCLLFQVPQPGLAQGPPKPGCLALFPSHHPGIPQGTAPLGLASPWVGLAHPYWAPAAHERPQLPASPRGEFRRDQHTWRTGGMTPDRPRGAQTAGLLDPAKWGTGSFCELLLSFS